MSRLCIFQQSWQSAQRIQPLLVAVSARGAAQPVDVAASAVKEANTTLSAKAAVEIFVAKHSHTSRDALSCKLAVDYGITSKSVRGTHACARLRAADLCWGSRRRGAWGAAA